MKQIADKSRKELEAKLANVFDTRNRWIANRIACNIAR